VGRQSCVDSVALSRLHGAGDWLRRRARWARSAAGAGRCLVAGRYQLPAQGAGQPQHQQGPRLSTCEAAAAGRSAARPVAAARQSHPAVDRAFHDAVTWGRGGARAVQGCPTRAQNYLLTMIEDGWIFGRGLRCGWRRVDGVECGVERVE